MIRLSPIAYRLSPIELSVNKLSDNKLNLVTSIEVVNIIWVSLLCSLFPEPLAATLVLANFSREKEFHAVDTM